MRKMSSGFSLTPMRRCNLAYGEGGFTLIEMIVAIAILGILTAIILVSVGDARGSADKVHVENSLRQLRLMAEIYLDDNDESYAGYSSCVNNPNVSNCLNQERADSVNVLTVQAEAATNQPGSLAATSGPGGFCILSPMEALPSALKLCVDNSGVFQQSETVTCGVVAGDPACIVI